MKAEITAIRDRGDLHKERIVIKALEPVDIGHHLLVRTASPDGTITTGVLDTYWFPDKDIAAGDYIVLYTKKGRDSEKEFKNAVSHFFYWGKSEPLWNEDAVSAVLFFAPDWNSFA